MLTTHKNMIPTAFGDWLRETEAAFADRSYYVREKHHNKLLESLDFGIDEWTQLSRHVFAILKPDAVVRGKAVPICEWLEANGYRIDYCDILWEPEEWQFETLYQYNLTLRNEHNQIGSWWLNRQLYTLAPSILMLLSLPNDPTGVYEKIAHDKGKSDPLSAANGTLRYEFKATNMTMNLFHCSDDPFSTAREFLIYRSEKELISFLSGYRSKCPVHTLQRMQVLQPTTSFDPDITARRIAIRLLISCGLEDLVEGLFAPARDNESMRQRLINTHQLLACIKGSLLNSNSLAVEHLRTDLALRFLEFPYIRDVQMDRLIKEIQSIDIPVSNWEALALISTCHYVEGGGSALK